MVTFPGNCQSLWNLNGGLAYYFEVMRACLRRVGKDRQRQSVMPPAKGSAGYQGRRKARPLRVQTGNEQKKARITFFIDVRRNTVEGCNTAGYANDRSSLLERSQ